MSGYTPVPNDVLDRLMAELDPYTFKVYLHVLRQTTGWHRTACQISLTQFQQATGIAKRNVIVGALKALADRRLITATTAPGVTTSYQLVTAGYHPLVTDSYQSPVTPGYSTKERGQTEVTPEDTVVWETAREALRSQMSAANWGYRLAGLRLVARDGGLWTLQAPTHHQHVELVSQRWGRLIERALEAAVGQPVRLKFVPPSQAQAG